MRKMAATAVVLAVKQARVAVLSSHVHEGKRLSWKQRKRRSHLTPTAAACWFFSTFFLIFTTFYSDSGIFFNSFAFPLFLLFTLRTFLTLLHLLVVVVVHPFFFPLNLVLLVWWQQQSDG
jgi:hypothetical protein